MGTDSHDTTASRATRRCARHALGLLDERETLLLLPADGQTLVTLLEYTGAEGRSVQLVLPTTLRETNGGRRVLTKATELQITCRIVADVLVDEPTLCFAETHAVALDGSATVDPDALTVIQTVRPQLPVYLLAPLGPDRSLANQAVLGKTSAAPALSSAIITSRGIYRPAMVARYLDERDTPLDVIPLL
jgi:methylthioribose-1-phosphate isomerase